MNTYPDDLFESIEFDLVKAAVAKRAVTARGQERILQLKPSSDFQTAVADLSEVNDVLGLYQSDFSLPALASEDIKPFLLRLKIQGATLEGEDFLILKNLVESFNRVYAFFQQHAARTPSIQSKLAHLRPNKEVPAEIDRVLDRRGIVKTSASTELGKIRAELTKKRAAADRIFYRALKKYQTKGVLADIGESVHENKRVLAIEGAYKGQVTGVFHGSSAKSTLFYLEPAESIEINNEIGVLEDEERREVLRVLRQLTAYVAGFREELRDFSTALYQIDFINAKALYAFEEEACLPRLSEKPHIELINAVNPVLRRFHAAKDKKVVPLQVQLNSETRILVISGPNAGGKSITLKTIGLLQLMLQSGLLVPVHPDSTMGWFNGIMADIGDAQSIENELSTYSSKLAKMRHFLRAAYSKTLVLIDEFGSGSDPDLGSSMAQVFLSELNETKTFGVMTTHYNAIKALAEQLPRVVNGSMQFNSADLSPEYVLNQGIPGSSYTYEVAQQVGIPTELIERARAVLDERTVAVDQLLVGIQKEKNHLAEQRLKLADRLEELERLRRVQAKKIETLEDKVQRQSAINQEQNALITWGKRFQGLVNEYGQAQSKKEKDQVLARFKVHAGERLSQREGEQAEKKSRYQKQKEEKIKALTTAPAKVGDRVKLIGSRQAGEIIEIKKDQYLLAIGALSTWVTRDKFIPAESLHGDEGTVKGKARGGVKTPEQEPETAGTAASTAKGNEERSNQPRGNSKKAPPQRKAAATRPAENPKAGNSKSPNPKSANAAEAHPKAAKPATAKPKEGENETIKNGGKKKRRKPAKASNVPAPKEEPALSTAEKFEEATAAPVLKTPPIKKSSGKGKAAEVLERENWLAKERAAGAASETGEESAPKTATLDDLEKLKAFFNKK